MLSIIYHAAYSQRPMKRVVFVCVENSNRSQMAEAFARMLGGVEVYSAGSRPSGKVNPKAIAAMQELGYDLTGHESKSLAELPEIEFDAAVTMGCGDACPTLRARARIDWQIPDPKEMRPEEYSKVRDLIGDKVRELLRELKAPGMTDSPPLTVATTPVQPRLGISHLLLWMLGAAVVLSVYRWWSGNMDNMRPLMRMVTVCSQVSLSLLAGINIAAVIVFARRLLVRDAPLLFQPGHWLLLIAGVVNLVMWLLFGAAMGIKSLWGVSDPLASIPFQFLPMVGAFWLSVFMNLLAIGMLAPPARWRRYFLVSALFAGMLALVFGAMFLASLEGPAGWSFSFPVQSFACLYPLDQLAAIVLLSFNFVADRADRAPHDWVHRLGVVATILQSIATLGFFWLQQWVAAAGL